MQTAKSVNKTRRNIKSVALCAMFAALTATATAFIRIPTPIGYAHAGDSLVFLAACALPAPFGFIAAAIGGALADLLSGYAAFALPTALIKALNVLPFFLVRLALARKNKDDRILRPAVFAALLLSAAITVLGYFTVSLLFFDVSAAWAEVPFNIMQSVVGAVLFTALALALDAIGFKHKII